MSQYRAAVRAHPATRRVERSSEGGGGGGRRISDEIQASTTRRNPRRNPQEEILPRALRFRGGCVVSALSGSWMHLRKQRCILVRPPLLGARRSVKAGPQFASRSGKIARRLRRTERYVMSELSRKTRIVSQLNGLWRLRLSAADRDAGRFTKGTIGRTMRVLRVRIETSDSFAPTFYLPRLFHFSLPCFPMSP